MIFGECQALLYNYENTLVKLFGDDYSINENLAFSLQFSTVITKEQRQAQKNLLSKEVKSLVEYIDKYRAELSEEVFNSQEYSVKLVAIPKVASASRNDISVEFLKWDTLSLDEQEEVKRLTAIVKNKVVKVEGVNAGRYRPGIVSKMLVSRGISNFKSNPHHTYCWKLFNVRPSNDAEDPFNTNTKYCYYDEAHNDYLYTEKWIELLVKVFSGGGMTLDMLFERMRNNQFIELKDFE